MHEGSLGLAFKFIENSKKAGADAVKFQMHIAKEESSNLEKFRKVFSHQDKTRYDYWERTSFDIYEWRKIRNFCKKLKIHFICSPFSIESANILKKLKLDAWKIASGEFENILLINHIRSISSKPIILSTGLVSEIDIKNTLKELNLKKNFSLLQCTSKYPTSLDEVGHKYIKIFKKKYKCPAGVSDHSGNINSLYAAVALKSDIIETHVTFHKNFFGPDVSSSITFEELKDLCNFNLSYELINSSKFNKTKLSKNQKKMQKLFTQSLTINRDLAKGQLLKANYLSTKKPGYGLKPKMVKYIINKKSIKNLKNGTFIKIKDFK